VIVIQRDGDGLGMWHVGVGLLGETKERDRLDGLDVYGRIILK
jgi:hypothetical protein